MVRAVPAGGNWQNIPISIPSKRLEQIRESGGRTTYYGRLKWDSPAYTITTYFNRPGNGCNMHPDDEKSEKPQHRLISFREAARLQSFPDNFRFWGPKTSLYNQIGNAVPPLLAYSIAGGIPGSSAVDLFAGCGGMSLGFEMAGYDVLAGAELNKHAMQTWAANHKGTPILGNITEEETKQRLYDAVRSKLEGKRLDVIMGGPPCQGFSFAGWRASDDPRNQLWRHYLSIVQELNPRWFVIENVPGLLSMKSEGKSVLQFMAQAFGEIGYSINYKLLKAEEYGVPQKRRRIFIIGNSVDETITFPTPTIDKPFTVFDAISNLPALGVSDGKDEVFISNLPLLSKYQEWCAGKITAKQLFGGKRKRRQVVNQQAGLFG